MILGDCDNNFMYTIKSNWLQSFSFVSWKMCEYMLSLRFWVINPSLYLMARPSR